jgi:hypothetical protein
MQTLPGSRFSVLTAIQRHQCCGEAGVTSIRALVQLRAANCCCTAASVEHQSRMDARVCGMRPRPAARAGMRQTTAAIADADPQ